MSTFSLPEQRRIDLAARLLDTVGRTADNENAVAALHCLDAVEYLSRAGANPTPPGAFSDGVPDVRRNLREALRLLALLPEEVFVLAEVVAATDAAQLAYQASK